MTAVKIIIAILLLIANLLIIPSIIRKVFFNRK